MRNQGLDQNFPTPDQVIVDSNELYREESASLELEAKRENIRRVQIENNASDSDITTKRRYGIWLLGIIALWLASVLAIISFTGAGTFKLSDKILLTLIGSTTANLVGLLYIVVSHLFPKPR